MFITLVPESRAMRYTQTAPRCCARERELRTVSRYWRHNAALRAYVFHFHLEFQAEFLAGTRAFHERCISSKRADLERDRKTR